MQFVFPSGSISRDPRSGEVHRHHLHESSLQKALKKAVRQAGIQKRWVVIHFDIVLLPTYSKTATISARYRNYLDIRMSKQR
jgi:hypothetical protein